MRAFLPCLKDVVSIFPAPFPVCASSGSPPGSRVYSARLPAFVQSSATTPSSAPATITPAPSFAVRPRAARQSRGWVFDVRGKSGGKPPHSRPFARFHTHGKRDSAWSACALAPLFHRTTIEFCWFERMASPAQIKAIYWLNVEHVKVKNDFCSSWEKRR
jgi:hypothetical protein